jgi:hypothetical protein
MGSGFVTSARWYAVKSKACAVRPTAAPRTSNMPEASAGVQVVAMTAIHEAHSQMVPVTGIWFAFGMIGSVRSHRSAGTASRSPSSRARVRGSAVRATSARRASGSCGSSS